jgi:type IV pilus assembly protein PilA
MKGFTLIELMIVVAIIGILSVSALPSFQETLVRAQIAEAISLSDNIKKAITEYYYNSKQFPQNNEAAGIPKAEHLVGNFVTQMQVENGAIHVTLGNRINALFNGKVLTLRPAFVPENLNSPISWLCGYAEPVNKMVAQGQNKTNISAINLSINCRSWKG